MERDDLRMVCAEIGQEVAGGAAVLACRRGRQRDTERIDSAVEQLG
jgi:hypothetical protein